MAISSDNVVYAFAVQTDQDTINTGPYTAIERRSGGFSSAGEEADSDTVGASGMKDTATLGKISHSASFEFDFKPSPTVETLLESAYRARWTGDVLTLGKNPLYMTWIVYNPGLEATRQYTRFSGCVVNSLNMTFPKDGSGLIGFTAELGIANREFLASAVTINDPAAVAKVRTCDALTVQVDNVEVPSIIDSLNVQLSSENSEIYDIRTCDPAEIIIGAATFGGTMVQLHDNDSDQYYKDAAAGTEFELDIVIDTPTTDYTINVPRTVNRSTGPDYTNDNATVSVPFGATGTPPTITRVPV